MLLIEQAAVFRIKGRGAVILGRGMMRAIARIGDMIEVRDNGVAVCRTRIRAIESLMVSPPPPPGSYPFGILIDDSVVIVDGPNLSVWLVEQENA